VVTEALWREERADRALRDELDARHPERRDLRPRDVAGLRTAFGVLEDLWASTIEQARQLPPEKLHERVNGEYSFVETFRHLLFAWEAWLSQPVLRVTDGYHAWAIPPDDGFAAEAPNPVLWSQTRRGGPWSRCDEAPQLDAVLAVRADYWARARDYLSTATPDDVNSPGTPPPWHQGEASVLYCLRVVLHDEWWHHQFATRDLAVLVAQA
jgi:hypothetical protein